MTLSIAFTVPDKRWSDLLKHQRPFFKKILTETIGTHNFLPKKEFEVSVVLTDDAQIQELNHTYRQKNKATNVLSFPQIENIKDLPKTPGMAIPLGDIVIAYETTFAEANDNNKTLRDHVAHLLIHGMLHLLGHDHEIDTDATTMETLEKAILASVGIADPYA